MPEQDGPTKVDIASFYAEGSLTNEQSQKESKEVEGDEEAHEDEAEEDTSEDDADDESEAEDDDDDGEDVDEDDFEEEDEDEEDDAAKVKAAEKKRAGFQSENAKLKNKNKDLDSKVNAQQQQINQLMLQMTQTINNPANHQANTGEADLGELETILGGDPDDFPTKAEIKKIVKAVSQRATPKQSQQASTAWMYGQDDFQSVNDYANKNNLNGDPYFMGAQTDETGVFFAIRSKILSSEIKSLKSENSRLKKAKKKKRKGKVPATGSRGSTTGTKRGPAKDGKDSFWSTFDGKW